MCQNAILIIQVDMEYMMKNPKRAWSDTTSPGGRRHLIYAPPRTVPGWTYKRSPEPHPAFKKDWQRSVYYFWWEYLRRHEGYRRCCKRGGSGRYAKLYRDFGNVHTIKFVDWWEENGLELFGEPRPPDVEVIASPRTPLKDGYIRLDISLELAERQRIKKIKEVLPPPTSTGGRGGKYPSRAKYEVVAKPVIAALGQTLLVWDMRKAHPEMALWEIYDACDGLDQLPPDSSKGQKHTRGAGRGSDRPTKSTIVSRHLRIAQQYIDNIVTGKFPLRDRR